MKRVRVKGRYWTLTEVPDVVEAAGPSASKRDQERGLDGICVFDTRSILISASLTPQYRLEVVIHELLHALHPELTERTVDASARNLSTILYDLGARLTGRI